MVTSLRERREHSRDWDARRERREDSSARDVSSITKHVCIFALICLFLEFCVFSVLVPVFLCNLLVFASEPVMIKMGFLANCSCSFLQVLIQDMILWILLDQSYSMLKFITQHLLDLGLLLRILKFTSLCCFIRCNFISICSIAFQNSWSWFTCSFRDTSNIQDWPFHWRYLVF
jgi:uncharacterized membrane protein